MEWEALVGKALESLPGEESEYWRQAKELAPREVLEREAKLDWFLRADDFHPAFAAKRIARYWALRSQTFGPMRFSPLHQTGDGALDTRELYALNARFVTLLPETRDSSPVIWIDGARAPVSTNKTPFEDSKKRVLFYAFSLLAEVESLRTRSVFLYKLEQPSIIDTAFLEDLAHALPIRIKEAHLLSHRSIPSGLSFDFADKTYIHERAPSKQYLLDQLSSHGMQKSGLPTAVNGTWTFDKIITWQELRVRMEWRAPLGYAGRSNEVAYSFPGISPYPLLEDRQERFRRANSIQCRRKRSRARFPAELIREEAYEHRIQQDILLEEGERLEGLLKQAQTLVEELESHSTITEGSTSTV